MGWRRDEKRMWKLLGMEILSKVEGETETGVVLLVVSLVDVVNMSIIFASLGRDRLLRRWSRSPQRGRFRLLSSECAIRWD